MLKNMLSRKNVWIPIAIALIVIIVVAIGVSVSRKTDDNQGGKKTDNITNMNEKQDDVKEEAPGDAGLSDAGNGDEKTEDSVNAPSSSWGEDESDDSDTEGTEQGASGDSSSTGTGNNQGSGSSQGNQDNQENDDSQGNEDSQDSDNMSSDNVLQDGMNGGTIF